MKSNKIVAGFVSAAFLSLTFVAPVAAAPVLTPIKEVVPIKELQPQYQGFTGVVKKIDLHSNIAAGKILFVEDKMGGPAHIIVAEDTYIVDNAEIAVGDEIIYFYDISRPMIMIYPPQIKADVIALKNSESNIKVDIFDKELVSLDNTLKLNITDETQVVLRDGSIYKGSLANQKLAVIYDVSTKSIPAQTNPKRVIVLDIDADENHRPDVSKMDIVIDHDMIITAPKAFYNEKGVVMVPLRAIAEALGYEVGFDGQSYSISVGEKAGLKINSYNYTKADGSVITLDTPPALVDNTTFVPLNFFTEVLMMNNAYVFEGQIVINNGEIMR